MSTVMSISKFNNLVSIPVKFKLLQLCQSNPSLFSNTIRFYYRSSSKFTSKNSLYLPLLISAERLVQIQEQLVLSILFPVSRVTSSCPRTACAFYFVFFQPSNWFVSKKSLCFLYFLSAKWPAQVQEQLAPFVVNIPGQVASSHPRTACTCQMCY